MPALSLLDTFTDSDKALASHTPDYSDYAWTNHASFTGTAASVYGNRAVPANGESAAYLSLAVPDRASEAWGVEAPVYYAGAQSGSYGGLFAGTTGAKTGYVVYWYGGTWALGKYVAGTWTALGTYSESFSTGTSKTIRMRFTSTQVIVSIDGTDRITATDSSITPTRIGVYGDRATLFADATGFHLSDVTFVGRAFLNPAKETDTAVALTFVPVGSITCNEYGEARISVGRLSGSPTLERGPDGSTWTDVTSEAFVDMDSGSSRTIVDHRPQYGAGSVDWGDTIHYRLTDGANVLTFSVTADVDKQQVRRNSWAVMSAYMATQTNGCVTSQAGSYYPGEWLVSMALAYLDSVDQGSPNSQFLTDVENQHTYAILPLINADDVLHFPAFASTDRDYHCRTAAHVAIASRLLAYSGQSSLSNTLLATADIMGKSFWDQFNGGSPTASHTRASYDPSGQTAWASGTSYAAGAIVRKTTNNSHTYRAMNAGTSGGVEPTWPTSSGATVSDNGITWKETSVTAPCTYSGYNVSSPYSYSVSGPSVDPNKNATEALLMALLLTDNRSSFYSAGTYRTKATDHVEDVCLLVAACQGSGGMMSLGDAWPVGEDAYDTLYAAYTLQQLSMVQHLLGDVVPELPLVLSSTLNWLETRSGGASEPQTRIKYGGSSPWGSADVGIGDILWRVVAARTLGTTSVIDKLPYSAAFWDSATHRYTPYTPDGGGTPYSGLYQAVWEADAVIEAIIARIDLTPAEETDTAVALSYGRAFSITPATETDAAQTLTIAQPQTVTLTPATEADAAVGLSWAIGGQHVSITPAAESDEAMALSFGFAVPQEVTLTPATESDAAVTLRITRSGSFAMNMQMAPGTVVGAYLRHEWIGSEVPVRGTGSYPGVAVTTATVDDYGEVEFTGLDVGSYIAWAEDYPLRRRFFVMTG